MHQPIRLVATDLDGTLLRTDGTVSQRTRNVLARVAARVPVVLVTARPPRRARLMARDIGVAGHVICCNGAIVYDTTADSVVTHSPIATADARALVQKLRAATPGVCFAFELELRYGCEPQYRELASRDGVPAEVEEVIGDALELCSSPVSKIIVRHPLHDAAALAEVLRTTAAGFLATYSGTTFVEISREGVNKASALAAVCSRLGVEHHEVVAFGDMRNDLPMLMWAGHAIAVANAHPDVLAAVHDVTASNDNDGVAQALERLVLHE